MISPLGEGLTGRGGVPPSPVSALYADICNPTRKPSVFSNSWCCLSPLPGQSDSTPMWALANLSSKAPTARASRSSSTPDGAQTPSPAGKSFRPPRGRAVRGDRRCPYGTSLEKAEGLGLAIGRRAGARAPQVHSPLEIRARGCDTSRRDWSWVRRFVSAKGERDRPKFEKTFRVFGAGARTPSGAGHDGGRA